MVWYALKNVDDCVHYGVHNTTELQRHSNLTVVRRWAWELREETGRGWVVVISDSTYDLLPTC